MVVPTPIVVDQQGDIDVYRSLEDAERAIEAEDAERGIYRVYDADGNSLRLVTNVEEQKTLFGLIRVSVPGVKLLPNPRNNSCRLEIERALASFLSRVSKKRGIATTTAQSLEELIAAYIELLGFSDGHATNRD